CNPNTPPDNDSVNEGICPNGPTRPHCAIETSRVGCFSNSECPAPGDSCVFPLSECFTDNGVIGQSVTVGGVASTTAPTPGAIGCGSAGLSAAIDNGIGLPGLVRYTLPGTAVLQ